MHLFIGSSNPGKLRDFAHAAAAFPSVVLAPLPSLEKIYPPDETADTFAGNALIKATVYSAHAPGQIVLADDSGIAVRGLGGAPGVRSARFADDEAWTGPGTPDQRNMDCLLDRTRVLRYKDVSYLCALAAVRDGRLLATGEGELQGQLLDSPRGTEGFGYDPIFEILELAQTMAELDSETRMQFSHRGRALTHLLQNLAVAEQSIERNQLP